MSNELSRSIACWRQPLEPFVTPIDKRELSWSDAVDAGREEEAAIGSDEPPAPVYFLGSEPAGCLSLRAVCPAAEPVAAKKFERELTTAREEAKKAGASTVKVAELEKAHEELRRKHDEAASEAAKHKDRAAQLESEVETSRHELEGVRAELENLRTDLNAAAGEKDLLSEEREELKKQLEEAQVTAVANEDRAVKAYQKIKSDEKLREKTRKALEIALQLLQENATDAEDADAAEKKSA